MANKTLGSLSSSMPVGARGSNGGGSGQQDDNQAPPGAKADAQKKRLGDTDVLERATLDPRQSDTAKTMGSVPGAARHLLQEAPMAFLSSDDLDHLTGDV